jgi:hypothetical protein
MGTQAFAVILLLAAPVADDRDRDLAELLASIGDVTKDRWDLTFDADTDTIALVAKREILARVTIYGYPPFEQMYRIGYRLRVVPRVEERIIERLRRQFQSELTNLRDLASRVPHEESKGHVTYHPQTPTEWQLVLRVKRAETRLREIPRYAFKSIYLSPDYETPFTPRAGDSIGSAMANDINALYALLRVVETGASTPPPGGPLAPARGHPVLSPDPS